METTKVISSQKSPRKYTRRKNKSKMTQYEEAVAKICSGQIEWKDALKIEDRNDLLNLGYLPAETGYCIMPDGTGFVANITKMKNVTPEMFDWWFAWHGLKSIRFNMWNKEEHFDIKTTKIEQILNPSLSLKEKLWGVTHNITRDIGFGPEKIHVDYMSPGELGFDINRFIEPYVSSVVGGNTDSSVMCHFVRRIEEGIEVRSRFWIGYQIINKEPVKILPDGTSMLSRAVKRLALHCTKDYDNLAKILPLIYYEERNKWR